MRAEFSDATDKALKDFKKSMNMTTAQVELVALEFVSYSISYRV